MDGKHVQKSGNNSEQYQFTNCNIINCGITEEQARVIINEQIECVIKSCSEVAQNVATKRLEKFARDIIPTLVKENLLESLKKPEILVATQESAQQAQCTDNEERCKILSNLLVNRIKSNCGEPISSYLKRATDVAVEITDESLVALAIFFMIEKYIPMSCRIEDGLASIDQSFGVLNLEKLNNDKNVIEQLDILNLVRISPVGKMTKIIDYYYGSLNGYSCVGIKNKSNQYDEAIKILESGGLEKDNLLEHELNNEYVRLPLVIIDEFDFVSCHVAGAGYQKMSSDYIKTYQDVINLYEKNDIILMQNKNVFTQKWNSFTNLSRVKDWWDNNECAFSITKVGAVLAYTYINNLVANSELRKKFPQIELDKL